MKDIIEYTNPYDNERKTLRALRATYLNNGSQAIIMWECDENGKLTSLGPWGALTVNGVMCPEQDVVALDTNNNSPQLIEAAMKGFGFRFIHVASSGYCTYDVVAIDHEWYESLADIEDAEELYAA